jgi:hypothetical protein
MTAQQDVSEFIVVPPLSQRAAVLGAKERFVDYLQRRFPRYLFTVSGLCPVEMEGEHYLLVPVMNYRSPDGASLMCKAPPNYVVSEIYDACHQFRADDLRQFAA